MRSNRSRVVTVRLPHDFGDPPLKNAGRGRYAALAGPGILLCGAEQRGNIPILECALHLRLAPSPVRECERHRYFCHSCRSLHLIVRYPSWDGLICPIGETLIRVTEYWRVKLSSQRRKAGHDYGQVGLGDLLAWLRASWYGWKSARRGPRRHRG